MKLYALLVGIAIFGSFSSTMLAYSSDDAREDARRQDREREYRREDAERQDRQQEYIKEDQDRQRLLDEQNQLPSPQTNPYVLKA